MTTAPTDPSHPTLPSHPLTLPRCGIGDEAALDAAGQVAAVTALGWRQLELRTVDGVPLAELPDAAFADAAARIRDAGLTVPAVDARIGGWARPVTGDLRADLDELAVLARRCAVLGTRYVRIMSFPQPPNRPQPVDSPTAPPPLPDDGWEGEAIRRTALLAERAADAGLVLLHENCAGWAGASADRAARLLDAVGTTALGLLYDTGNGPAYGYDGLELLHGLLPHIAHIHHVHLKDARLGPDGSVHYRPPGEGELDVVAAVRLLCAHGYRGSVSIEPHTAVRPHEDHRDPPEQCRAAFLAAGRAAERVLAAASAASAAAPPAAPLSAREDCPA